MAECSSPGPAQEGVLLGVLCRKRSGHLGSFQLLEGLVEQVFTEAFCSNTF